MWIGKEVGGNDKNEKFRLITGNVTSKIHLRRGDNTTVTPPAVYGRQYVAGSIAPSCVAKPHESRHPPAQSRHDAQRGHGKRDEADETTHPYAWQPDHLRHDMATGTLVKAISCS